MRRRRLTRHLVGLPGALFGLGLAALTSATPDAPYLRFEGASYLRQSDRSDPFALRKFLYPALKEAGILRIEVVAGADSVVQERSASGMMYLDRIPAPALHAILLMLPAKQAGAEIDIWVQGKGAPADPDRMWTIRRDLAGGIVVLKGGPPLALDGPDPSPAELAARFGIGALEDSSDARWSTDERRALERALELLSPRELERIAGISFHRARQNAEGNAGFHEGSHRGEPGRITIFDSAFVRTEGLVEYAGSPDQAVPTGVIVIVHEIGHALADAERRGLLIRRRARTERYDAYKASYESSAKRYERLRSAEGAGAEKERQRLWAELERLKAAAQVEVDEIRDIDAGIAQLAAAPSSVEGRYAALPGATDGPTEYGRSALQESFAEAFALYRVDPESLRWIAPSTHDWFAAEEHLSGNGAPLPDVAAPAVLEEPHSR